MTSIKKYLVVLVFLIGFLPAVKSQYAYPDPGYHFLTGQDYIQDRNFYLFTLFEKMPAVTRIMARDTTMQRIGKTYVQRVPHPVSSPDITAITDPFLFTGDVISRIGNTLPDLLTRYPAEIGGLVKAMRSSGLFQLYAGMPDTALLARAWKDAAQGVNYIINAYTTNKGFRYAAIDSAVYDVSSPAYKIKVAQALKDAGNNNRHLFFRPSLDLALALLRLNKRDECARYEPLSDTNREAYTQLKKTDWDKYTFSALLILGAGPGNTDAISDAGKNRCRIGADLFRKGIAPCIIVSGGHVHPIGTPFSEAVEMKKYLVNELKIPAAAVILEPYARHTTTNIRNAVRIAWRNGFPMNKKMCCVSDPFHLNYVSGSIFNLRCMQELSYLPATEIKQADLYFLSFMPDLKSLQADARDPLDP